MHSEIQTELTRVVGGPGVDVTPIETEGDAAPRVRLETANATYHLPPDRLLRFLRELPDRAGVNALRQSLEGELCE